MNTMVWRVLARTARFLGALCLLIVAAPIVYAVGSLALVYGFYALWAAVAFVCGLFVTPWYQSFEDAGAMLGFGLVIGVGLALCAGVLYGILVALYQIGRLMLR